MRYLLVLSAGLLLFSQLNFAQAPKKSASTEIYHSLQKLNFLGTALYIAAHPDDENTRLIAYMSNQLKARTGYLSITRGDGGQNLIGPELQELLGVLRTQELLAARNVDGGEQFFTLANDFGYSKHPDETLKIWGKEAVLGDVVWVIRNFRPDVIINRFDHRTPGSTHGHHTSSAMLSVEAFNLANQPEAYSNQLKLTDVWQPTRLFFNTSWWFYGSQENFEKADKSNMLDLDTGVYYPERGLSNNEIAAQASSQHLCQGFGRMLVRGSENEYIELLEGEMPTEGSTIFDGINTSWSRVSGGEAVGDILYEVEKNFNFKNPSVHLASLLEAHKLLQKVSDAHWRSLKKAELESLIAAVCGLYLEASAETPIANPGSSVEVAIEAVNRSDANILLKSVAIGNRLATIESLKLENNQKKEWQERLSIVEEASYSSPYWLSEKGQLGRFQVKNQELIGRPETPRGFHVAFNLEFDGYPITIKKAIIHKFAKPDKGERYQPFEVLPEATARFDDKVLIFADGTPRQVSVIIKAHKDSLQGEVQLRYPNSWTVEKDLQPFQIANKGDEKTVMFTVIPPNDEHAGHISPILKINGKELSKELVTIAYDHIPTQSVLLPSEAKVVRLNIQKSGDHIGYIEGAGDDVPKSLEQIGYVVHKIDVTTIQAGSLDQFDAIVMGIRAYNVVDELKFKQRFLLEYVKNGGNLIVQYNTSWRGNLDIENLAPYPLNVSRHRVADENSQVQILAASHPVVNIPNRIRPDDFNGWVQERGLYFPDSWDSAFTPILSMNDEGEAPMQGSLLVAPYGKGHYIYTGLSFFRELPAGVPGAYKLFANMLSLGKEKALKENAVKG